MGSNRLNLKDITVFVKDGTHGSYKDVECGYPLLSAKDIDNGHILIPINARKISEKDYRDIYKKYNLQNGDVLITIVGTVGRTAIVPPDFPKVAFQRSVGILRPNTSYVTSQFLEYALNTDEVQNDIMKRVNKGAQGGIYLGELEKVTIEVPSIGEQEQIAGCISAVDTVIADYEAQVENMQNQKKGVMQKLFSQEVRFKADDGREYPAWEYHTFADVGRVSMCKRIFKEQTSDDGDVPFYKIGTFGGEPDAYISKELFLEFKEKYSYPKIGAILLSASGTLGRTVKFDGEDAYFQDSNIIWLEHDESVLDAFLEYLYKVVHWQEPEGGTIKRLYNKNFLETAFELPCLEEQQKIADCLSAFDTAIEDLQKTVEHWRNLKKGLLQQLFV